jgi:ribosomal protein S26
MKIQKTRKCSKCLQADLLVGERRAWCKKCTAEYCRDKYAKDPEHRARVKKGAAKHSKEMIAANTILIKAFLEANPCVDCGIKDIRVLECHHRDPKEKSFNISHGRTHSKENFLKELNKCDVICSNCHRIRHYGTFTKIDTAPSYGY